MTATPHNFRLAARRGFTLTELLVVIGLFVVLMIAISSIFTSTSRAVGTGQAISDGLRDLRGSQAVFENDFARIQTVDAPFLMITSRRESAFGNANDAQADRNYDSAATTATQADRNAQELTIRTYDVNADGLEDAADETINRSSPILLTPRSHRVDLLQFFARGKFVRQTGNNGIYAAPMTSAEAFIRYGHVRQPDNSAAGVFCDPGPGYFGATGATPLFTAASNPNNFYATQWILGRSAVLLRAPEVRRANDTTAPPTGLFVYDDLELTYPLDTQRYLSRQDYYFRPAASLATDMYPLGAGSNASNSGLAAIVPLTPIQDSRYDLAGTTIRDFRQFVSVNDELDPAGAEWWRWFGYRNVVSLFPARPLTSAGLAQTLPAFVPHCTQFAVEFAGDFVTQFRGSTNPLEAIYIGDVISHEPDGVIDFVVDAGVFRTRWYGFPRDVNGDNVVQGYWTGPGGATRNNQLVDVVPVRDVMMTRLNNATWTANPPALPFQAPFEREVNAQIPLPDPAGSNASGDYANVNMIPTGYLAGQVPGVPLNAEYLCAWGPNEANRMPKMIRIIMRVEDPAGRIPDGQTVEYVFRLQ